MREFVLTHVILATKVRNRVDPAATARGVDPAATARGVDPAATARRVDPAARGIPWDSPGE